jgi:hypothetical protein
MQGMILPEPIQDYLRGEDETGDGYHIVDVILKDGKKHKHITILNCEEVANARGRKTIPFTLDQIDHVVVTHGKRHKYGYGLIRKGIYSIEDVLSKINDLDRDSGASEVEFDGEMIDMNSDRYHCFAEKGIKCVRCGLEGKFFAMERFPNENFYHFNLYALNDRGDEVLMTKDHILPRSKGGPDHIDNYQTMCTHCNGKKGNSLEDVEKDAV